MNDLRSHLEEIAGRFINSILNSMQGASLSDLADGHFPESDGVAAKRRAGRPPKAGATARFSVPRPIGMDRRKRSSSEEVQAQKDAVLAAARQLSPGFSKGDVTKKTRSKENLGRVLSLLVAEGRLTKKGDRRLTRYWVK